VRHGGRAVVSDERQGQPPRRSAELFVVDRPELVRRQAVLLGAGAKRSLVVLAAMVVLLGTGAVPPAVAGLLAAGAIVVSGVLTIEQAYRSIAWTTVILVAGMIPLSTAMTDTGGRRSPTRLAASALGQLISNMATTLILIPISISAAADLHVSAKLC
jgi:di/tricarboxylate transporter